LLHDDIADGDRSAGTAAAAATAAPGIAGRASARAEQQYRADEGDSSALHWLGKIHKAANFDCRSRLQAPAACDAGNMNMGEPLS
jgi:hypothetical protein